MTCRTIFVARSQCLRWFSVAAMWAALCPIAWADPTPPGANERQITLSVTKLVKMEHLSRHPFDKTISERCLKEFLKALDPMKVYFYQSDVNKFAEHKDDLSDWIRKGDFDTFLNFGYMVFRTFLQRVDERVKVVDELLALPHDFTVDEEMVVDRDALQYPRDPVEAYERWRKRIKYDLLVMKATKKDDRKEAGADQKSGAGAAKPEPVKTEKEEAKEAIDRLTRRYHSFAKRMHQYDSDELLEMYLNSFTTSFDPHTDYMSPKSQKNFDIAMSLKLEGIGASLQSEDGYTVVKRVIAGGAADKDGRLKMEDKITGVGQSSEGEIVDVVDMKLSDVVELIRGKRGTVVRLEVMPADGSARKVYAITREQIELKDSEAQSRVFTGGQNPDGTPHNGDGSASAKVFDASRKPDGTPYRVGVIDLPSFYRDIDAERSGDPNFKSATRDVRVILDAFRRQGVDAVILDLR